MTNEKKIKPPSCAELRAWMIEYTKWHNAHTGPQTQDDGNPDLPPPPPPGHGK